MTRINGKRPPDLRSCTHTHIVANKYLSMIPLCQSIYDLLEDKDFDDMDDVCEEKEESNIDSILIRSLQYLRQLWTGNQVGEKRQQQVDIGN